MPDIPADTPTSVLAARRDQLMRDLDPHLKRVAHLRRQITQLTRELTRRAKAEREGRQGR